MRREADPSLPERPRPSIANDAEHWTRLGPLLPDGQGDAWWRVVAGGDNDTVAYDVLRELEAYGLPWLRERAEPS